jgi:hypothetical protein
VPELSSFDYAMLRVVPRVEREEFVNAGVVVFCLERQFLDARVVVDEPRLRALWPQIDVEQVRRHLNAFRSVALGDPAAGPIARLSLRERFHWLVSPRSTIIQVSPVHTGICDEPEKVVEHLMKRILPDLQER